MDYAATDVSRDMSFLEMLDVVNDDLIRTGQDPIAFDSDCREGICGSCGLVVNGVPHGPDRGGTVCQLHMRRFTDGDTITIEPWRARRSPSSRTSSSIAARSIASSPAGGYVSVNIGRRPEANAMPIPRDVAETGDGRRRRASAAARAWPRARMRRRRCSRPRRSRTWPAAAGPGRTLRGAWCAMVEQMDAEGFGDCTNEGECQAVCPKEISIADIARMYRDYIKAAVSGARLTRDATHLVAT